MLAGPAETGKTMASLYRLHRLALRWPRSQHVIVRKSYASAVTSVVQSYLRKIITPDDGIIIYGGERPSWFDYPNGSRIWIGGMDNPDKVLSSERDSIYVNQAEELTLTDWEYLTTRATGRAGNMPFGQVFGDCNPGPSTHWIKQRKGMNFLEARHEDNPMLFTPDGAITKQGERTMSVLNNLTGVRKERLRFGRWASAEGNVYEFDPLIHVVNRFPIPLDWRRIRVIDFGFTNPFVCQWWAISPDGVMYRYRELYMSKRTVADHAAQILRYSGLERYEVTIADHDAEDRATLDSFGIHTETADKRVMVGIQAMQTRISAKRILYMRDSLIEVDQDMVDARKPTCTEQELESYAWMVAKDGKPVKEMPNKVDDHGCDASRYGVAYVDGLDSSDLDFGDPIDYRG